MAKRILDILASAMALVVFAPLLLVVCVLIRRKLGSPVFFRQSRPGFKGRPFEMIKFRTMANAVDAEGKPLPDEKRMTRLGNFLRKSSLDELPELWNVLKGDMSLVGPRPLLMQYLDRYTPFQARRHEVKPGLTGWAQINGRNAISWEKKFELDVWYVDHQSFWLDFKIILATVWKIVRRDGVSAADHVTMPEFMGSSAKKE
jgi:lipopolysaccharide/colanic/teichoic acid biosynthesis glycosyltransferase